MKYLKISVVCAWLFLIGFVLTGCAGGSKKDIAVPTNRVEYKESSTEVLDESMGLTATSGFTAAGVTGTDYAYDLSMEKIITKVNLEVETQDFDDLINSVKDDMVKLGGYEEKSEISGKRYYSRNTSRYAYIVARIPRERLNEFVEAVRENGNIINESSTSENVTLQYVDTASRKKALEIEQERLFVLLEKSESMEDIVTLESRLSNIRHELQMYETELRTIDNQVDYSTVTISIYEVERITPTEENESVFVRIKNGFGKTIYDISEGFKNFVVWFAVNLPYLIIWAVVITMGVIIFRKVYKKYSNNYKRKIQTIAEGEVIQESTDL
ncbi:MAG TPA: DUF4349 domain-containing protein [Mobilitalea sp.]|nr:DUF4349 domain-containing protein [Mobilitalea sp.]